MAKEIVLAEFDLRFQLRSAGQGLSSVTLVAAAEAVLVQSAK
jgi:hypothetical protein